MCILIVTDLHSQQMVLAPLASTVARRQIEAVLCLGDLTIHSPSAGPYTQRFLAACGYDRRPVLCISGNNDDPASLVVLVEAGCLLDNAEQTLASGQRVVGLGYRAGEQPFRPRLAGSILLTHVPPRQGSVPPGLADMPTWHLSGHLHSLERIWQMGQTTVVQVPSAMNLRAAVLDTEARTLQFIDLG